MGLEATADQNVVRDYGGHEDNISFKSPANPPS